VIAAESGTGVHHGASRCLPGLFDAEAERLSIEVRGFSRKELTALIESSAHEIPTTEHHRLHQEANDFVRWDRRGGRRTLALYGRPYFSLLASIRWGRVQLEALTRHRAGSTDEPAR
jgi:hypothetical protein